jgi:hypothetical protein
MDRCVLVYWFFNTIYEFSNLIIFNRRDTINSLRLIFLYG